jgi:signal peptidase I
VKWSVSRGIALTLATLIAVCGGWLLLAPTTVGGPVSLVITSGTSMQPRFHTGDLAVLHTASTYHVGDVVGYRSRTLQGAVVLHRLVAADGGRWTTKGDHNTWLDPDHPTNAEVIGKLWVHVPKGGYLLTRVLLPLALVGFICLLLPFRKRRSTDEDGEPVMSSASQTKRRSRRGLHAGRGNRALRNGRMDWLSREVCLAAIAGGLVVALIGSIVAIVGYARPLHRTATVSRASSTTVTFGWTGTSGNTLIYPSGRVADPAPIFPKVVDQITLTADVTAKGRPLSSAILTATLSDASGWTHQWQFDATADQVGPVLHLSGSVNLKLLLMQVAWVQATTGVSSPATLTLRVAQNGGAADSGPSLSFALSNATFKPQGPLTVTTAGKTATRASVPTSLTVSGHAVPVSQLRKVGAIAAALGLLVALAAGLLARRARTPSEYDRLLRLFAGRVVHLSSAEEWQRACLDVRDADSLSAFAANPAAVLYVVDAGDTQVFIAERGATRLRYVPERDAEARTAGLVAQDEAGLPAIPQQRPWAAEDGAELAPDVTRR